MKKQIVFLLESITFFSLFCGTALWSDEIREEESTQTQEHFVSTYDRLKGQEITPNAGPVVHNGVDIALEGSYILWHASQRGLDFVTSGVSSDNAISNMIIPQGTIYEPNFKLTSGYKAGMGFDFNYDGWDINLMYTWLYSHASTMAPGPIVKPGAINTPPVNIALVDGSFYVGGYFFPPSGNYYFYNNQVTDSSSSWRMHFNMFDWALGRQFFLSPKLTLRIHAGLKGGWINQNNKVEYTVVGHTNLAVVSNATVNTDDVITSPQVPTLEYAQEIYQINNRSSFWGVGIRTGLDTSWMFTRCFSLYADLAFSSLWGQLTIDRRDVDEITDLTTNAVVVSNFLPYTAKQKLHTLNPVLESSIGFCYDYFFCEEQYRFRVRAGWEHQIWWDLLPVGNFFLQGLSVDFRVDF